jgi:hypothetical protein
MTKYFYKPGGRYGKSAHIVADFAIAMMDIFDLHGNLYFWRDDTMILASPEEPEKESEKTIMMAFSSVERAILVFDLLKGDMRDIFIITSE